MDMRESEHCMTVAQHGDAAKTAEGCKMKCDCPMMQKHDAAADTPSPPPASAAPEHKHTPDEPAGH